MLNLSWARTAAVALAIALGCAGCARHDSSGKATGRETGSDAKAQNRLEQSGKSARENYAGQAMDGSFRSPQQAQRDHDSLAQPAPPAARKAPDKTKR